MSLLHPGALRSTRFLLAAALVLLSAGLAQGRARASEGEPAPSVAAGAKSELPPAPSRNQLRTSFSWALSRGTYLFNNAQDDDIPTYDTGVDLDYLHNFGGHFRLGVGARYEYGSGPSVLGGPPPETEHFGFVPFLFGWQGGSSKVKADVILGVGPTLGVLTWGKADGQSHLIAPGMGAELAPSLTVAVGKNVGLIFGLAIRFLDLSADRGTDADASMQGSSGFHSELAGRMGVTFDL